MKSSAYPALPTETWDFIISMIPLCGIDNFARSIDLIPLLSVSRRFHELALPHFYRYIQLTGPDSYLEPTNALVRMFEHKPERRVFVRGVWISSWPNALRDQIQDDIAQFRQQVLDRAVNLLLTLPNVQETRVDGVELPTQFHHWLLSCTTLRNIELTDYTILFQPGDPLNNPLDPPATPAHLTIANLEKDYDEYQRAIAWALRPLLSPNLVTLDVDVEAFHALGLTIWTEKHAPFPSLSALRVSHSNLTAPSGNIVALPDSYIINFIEAHPTLTTVSLDSLIIPDGFARVHPLPVNSTKSHMPSLLYFQGPLRIAARICHKTTSLQTLTILEQAGGNAKVDDTFLSICTNSLQRISMYGVGWEDGMLTSLAERCTNLTSIHVRATGLPSWNAVKEESMAALKKLPKLRVFMFQRCFADGNVEVRRTASTVQEVIADRQCIVQAQVTCPRLGMFYRPFAKCLWVKEVHDGGWRMMPMAEMTLLIEVA